MSMIERYGSKAIGVEFVFTETEPDGGGSLEIIGYDEDHKEVLCDYYRKEHGKKGQYAPLHNNDPLSIKFVPLDTASYGRTAHYAFPLALDDEWFIPYKKALERITGYTGDIGDFNIPDPRRICATHHRADWRVEDGHIQATVFVHTYAWNGLTALDYANRMAVDYFIRDIADSPMQSEFIPTANGQYKHNPDYASGRRLPPRAAVVSEPLWDALFAWWRRTHATPAQEAVLRASEALETGAPELRRPCYSIRWRQGPDYHLIALDPKGSCDWDGKGTKARVYTWDEFKTLGK